METSRSFFLLQVATKRDAIPLVEVSRRKSEQEKLKLSWVQYHWLRSWNLHGCNTTGWASKEKEWKREGEVGPAASDPFSLNFLREENNPSPNSIIFPWSWQEMSNLALFPSKYFCPIIISSSLEKKFKRECESDREWAWAPNSGLSSQTTYNPASYISTQTTYTKILMRPPKTLVVFPLLLYQTT